MREAFAYRVADKQSDLKRPGVSTPLRELRGGSPRARQLVWALLIAAVVAVVGFLSWSVYLKPVTVPVAAIQQNIREQVFGLGTVGARVQSNVGFKVSGVLVALKADQGDQVRSGQMLAQLDAHDIEAQVALSKAGVAQARANIEKAKADVASTSAILTNAKAISDRRAALAARGISSVEEAQTTEAATRVAAANAGSAQSAVIVAEAALQSAEAQQAFEQATLANYTLYSPYEARVISRNLELGSMPTPGQSVFTLVAARTVWVLAYVDERLAGRLRVGQAAEIILRSDPAISIPGHVERIEAQSDPINEERLVDVAFDKIPDDIHLAEQAEVVITTGVLPHALLVPPTAVSDLRDGRGTVWTVEKDRLQRRQVNFAPALLDGRLPILDGVPTGDAVVAASVPGLRVGHPARIAEGSPP